MKRWKRFVLVVLGPSQATWYSFLAGMLGAFATSLLVGRLTETAPFQRSYYFLIVCFLVGAVSAWALSVELEDVKYRQKLADDRSPEMLFDLLKKPHRRLAISFMLLVSSVLYVFVQFVIRLC